jgi:hypothetical protein
MSKAAREEALKWPILTFNSSKLHFFGRPSKPYLSGSSSY